MLDIIPAADHVAAYRLSGQVTGPDLDRLTADVEARLARHERIGIVADLSALDALTPAALWRDLRYGLGKLGELKRFPREAVIAGPGWLRSIAERAGPAVPGIEIKLFEPGETEAALRWAGDIEGGPNA